MISLGTFEECFKIIKEGEINEDKYIDQIGIIKEYLINKFKESKEIFNNLENKAIINFVKLTDITYYSEKEKIFEKNEKSEFYYFILYGDINLYENEFQENKKNILISTISEGSIYGHKIKEKYKFFAYSANSIKCIKIKKEKFDNFINNENIMVQKRKLMFIKKFFPQIRIYTDDVLINILQFFTKVEYSPFYKILNDDKYDEYIYIIIKGKAAVCKKVSKIKPEFLCDNNTYIKLDVLSSGDIFGAYSAIKENKSNTTIMSLSRMLVYKISKGHLLFYFGGHNGYIPKTVEAIDQLQQKSLYTKINFLSKMNQEDFKYILAKYQIKIEHKNNDSPSEISEISIKNTLCDAWKSSQNLDSKLSEFKKNLLFGNKNKPKNKENSLFKNNTFKNSDEHKIVDSLKSNDNNLNCKSIGLNSRQISSINKLGYLCGVKKTVDPEKLQKLANISFKMQGPRSNKLFNSSNDKDDPILNTKMKTELNSNNNGNYINNIDNNINNSNNNLGSNDNLNKNEGKIETFKEKKKKGLKGLLGED